MFTRALLFIIALSSAALAAPTPTPTPKPWFPVPHPIMPVDLPKLRDAKAAGLAPTEDIFLTGQFRQAVTGNTDSPTGVIAGWRVVTDNGLGTRPNGNGGYRDDYITKDANVIFDVGHVITSRVEVLGAANGHYEGTWEVGASHKTAQGAWSYITREINVGSFVDAGYQETINGMHMTGAHLFVPTVPVAFGPPNSSKNATYAMAVAGGPADYMAQFYNGFLINPDAIANGGRGIQFGGSTVAEFVPFAPFEVTRTWESGMRFEKATIRDNKAMHLSNTQKITRADGTEAVFLTRQQTNKLKRMLADQ